jgi:hypothetical protein
MERFTLQQVLASQDLGHTSIDAVCDSVLNDNYEVGEDLITGYIVEKFIENGFVNSSNGDRDSYATDIKYAIDQLQRALKVINDPELV